MDYQDHTVVRVYADTADAEAARQALLDAGFAREEVELSTLADEAGPVEGNFWVGNGDIDTPSPKSGPPGGNEKGSYMRNFANVDWGAAHVLAVAAHDARRAQAAAAIMDRHHALVADRHPGRDADTRGELRN